MTQKCPKYVLLRKRYQLEKLSMVPTASYLGRASGSQGLEGGREGALSTAHRRVCACKTVR